MGQLRKLCVLGAALVCLFSGGDSHGRRATPADLQKYVASLALTDFPRQIAWLHAHEFDVAGVALSRSEADVVATESEIDQLRREGFTVARRKSIGTRGPDAEYKTPEKVEALLKQYAASYPAISQVFSIGKSLEGREIWAMKITNPSIAMRAGKPRVLFNGMHHAREVMSTEVPLDIIDTLLTGYGKQPDITHWVDANEIWVVPMLNVDGNERVWRQDPMWRKNARGGYGVDINRNYPYAWNSCDGSSGSTSAQDYRGPSAASEPETHVLMGLVQKTRPVFDISFHSYSELVLYPYGCPDQRTPNHEVVAAIGKELADLIPTDDGKGTYTPGMPWDILYAVDGDDLSWMYHDMQVIPYVIELNAPDQGFQPSYKKWRDLTVRKLRPAWQRLLARLDQSALRGRVLAASGGPVSEGKLVIMKSAAGQQDQELAYTLNPDGTFHVVLAPGTYQVVFHSPGLVSKAREITVGEERREIDVQLESGRTDTSRR